MHGRFALALAGGTLGKETITDTLHLAPYEKP